MSGSSWCGGSVGVWAVVILDVGVLESALEIVFDYWGPGWRAGSGVKTGTGPVCLQCSAGSCVVNILQDRKCFCVCLEIFFVFYLSYHIWKTRDSRNWLNVVSEKWTEMNKDLKWSKKWLNWQSLCFVPFIVLNLDKTNKAYNSIFQWFFHWNVFIQLSNYGRCCGLCSDDDSNIGWCLWHFNWQWFRQYESQCRAITVTLIIRRTEVNGVGEIWICLVQWIQSSFLALFYHFVFCGKR